MILRKKELFIISCTIVFFSFVNYCTAFPVIDSSEADEVNDIFYQVNRNEEKKLEEQNKQLSLSFWDYFNLADIGKLVRSFGGRISSVGECLLCRFTVGMLQNYLENGKRTEDDVGLLALRICNLFNIEKPSVCQGVVKLFKRELTTVLTRVALSPTEICGFLLEGCGKAENPLSNWSVPLTPFPKPPVVTPKPPKAGAPVLRVLHLSDIHLDPFYKEGSNAKCEEPLCCREGSGVPETPEDAAGYFGDYRNCDTPLRTLEHLLDHINHTHQLDYVIWTGDIPPHDIWNNSRSEALFLLHEVSNLVHKYLGNVPIYPALGNHESSPVNSFPIPIITGNESISWLYREVEKVWSNWIPGQSNTIKLGAYYTVLVNPGFRIISLNMNYCNSLNWWLLINSTDPTEELAWLVTQLQMAEDNGEKVHILGHIPPGEPDCFGVWSANYYKIINRYESTVTAQFFGHTHQDEFEIFYDKSGTTPRPTSIVYIGPSVTTYDGVNPGYRIYTVDGNYPRSSYVVLDHETYITNLTESNLKRKLEWKFEYSAKKAYNMTSLLPSEWDHLVDRFSQNDELFDKFYLYYRKMTDFAVPECDEDCKKIFFCRFRRGQSNDPIFC